MTNKVDQSGSQTPVAADQILPISGTIKATTVVNLPDKVIKNDGYASRQGPVGITATLNIDQGTLLFNEFTRFLTFDGLRLYKPGERTGVIKGAFFKTIYPDTPREQRLLRLDVEAADIEDFDTANTTVAIGALLPLAKKADGSTILNLRDLLTELNINYVSELKKAHYVNNVWAGRPANLSEKALLKPGYLGWLPLIKEAIQEKQKQGEATPTLIEPTFTLRDKGLTNDFFKITNLVSLVAILANPQKEPNEKAENQQAENPLQSVMAEVDLNLGEENKINTWQLAPWPKNKITTEGRSNFKTKVAMVPNQSVQVDSSLSPLKLQTIELNEVKYELPLTLSYGLELTSAKDFFWGFKPGWTTQWSKAFLNLDIPQKQIEIPQVKVGNSKLAGIRFTPDSDNQGVHISVAPGTVSSDELALDGVSKADLKISVPSLEAHLPASWVDALGIDGVLKNIITSGYQKLLGPTELKLLATAIQNRDLLIAANLKTETSDFLKKLTNLGINIPEAKIDLSNISAHVKQDAQKNISVDNIELSASADIKHLGQHLNTEVELHRGTISHTQIKAQAGFAASVDGIADIMNTSANYAAQIDVSGDLNIDKENKELTTDDVHLNSLGTLSTKNIKASYGIDISKIDAKVNPTSKALSLQDLFSEFNFSAKNILDSTINASAKITFRDDLISMTQESESTHLVASPNLSIRGKADSKADSLDFSIDLTPSLDITQNKQEISIKQFYVPFNLEAQGSLAGMNASINMNGSLDLVDSKSDYSLTIKLNQAARLQLEKNGWYINGQLSEDATITVHIPKDHLGDKLTVPVSIPVEATVSGPNGDAFKLQTTLKAQTTLVQTTNDKGQKIYLPEVGHNSFSLDNLSVSQLTAQGDEEPLVNECAINLNDDASALLQLATKCESIPIAGITKLIQSVAIAGLNKTEEGYYAAQVPTQISLNNFKLIAIHKLVGRTLAHFAQLTVDLKPAAGIPSFNLKDGNVTVSQVPVPGIQTSPIRLSHINATADKIEAQLKLPEQVTIHKRVNNMDVSGQLKLSGLSQVTIATKSKTATLKNKEIHLTGSLTVKIPTKSGIKEITIQIDQKIPSALFKTAVKLGSGNIRIAINYQIPNLKFKANLDHNVTLAIDPQQTLDLSSGSFIDLPLSNLSGSIIANLSVANGKPQLIKATADMSLPDLKNGILHLAGNPLLRTQLGLAGENTIELDIASQNTRLSTQIKKGSASTRITGAMSHVQIESKAQLGQTPKGPSFDAKLKAHISTDKLDVSLKRGQPKGVVSKPEITIEKVVIKSLLPKTHRLSKLFKLPETKLEDVMPKKDYQRKRVLMSPSLDDQSTGSTHRLPPVI